MSPATAMGTFLRVWRSEWAGLSRAQLGVAVSAQLPKRKALTTKVIRKWEEGQPPSSTEELDALGKVMRRHGLTRPEVEDFRRAVFAACVDRQYPELWGGAEFAQREDLDEVARQIWGEAYWANVDRRPVAVVACLASLGGSVRRPNGPPGASRRQDVALALLQHAVADIHRRSGRWGLAHGMFQANNELLTERLGGSLGYPVTVECNRAEQLSLLGYRRSLRGEPVHQVGREMLESCRESAARKPASGLATHLWLAKTVDMLAFAGDAEDGQAACSVEGAFLASCDEWCGTRDEASYIYGNVARREHRWADAERYLAVFDHWHAGAGPERYRWHCFVGGFAAARGDHTEALEHLQQAQRLANQLGDHLNEAELGKGIRQCEDALRSARLRRAPR